MDLASIITASEDADIERLYNDCRDHRNNSAANKEKNALKHMNIFLERYCQENKLTYCKAEDLDYYGIDTDKSPTSVNTFWDSLFSSFFTYLMKYAYCNGDARKGPISYQTATSYASALKMYYINKFKAFGPEFSVFGPNQWRQLRNKLLSQAMQTQKETGKPIGTGHVASDDNDRKAIAIGCFWMASPESAEFLHLNNTMHNVSGRGSEVSLIKTSDLHTRNVNELYYNYQILSVTIQRQKGGPHQDIPIYPHRDSVYEDWYFSTIYSIIMGNNSEYLFPRFASKALHQSNDKNNSHVSNLWKSCFKTLSRSFQSLADTLNDKLTSHHGKKGSNQKMAESSALSGMAQIFRSGWEVRSCATLFDYVIGSAVMLQQAGKVISNWNVKVGDVIVGGQPPVLTDVKTDHHLVVSFVENIFNDDVKNAIPIDVRECLVASLIRHYDEFCCALQNHTDRVYDDVYRHPFCLTVKQKLKLSGVDDSLFDTWKKEITEGFQFRNLPALPIQGIENKKWVDEIMLDPRCFTSHFNALATAYQCLHSQTTRQAYELTLLRRDMSCMQRTQCDMVALLKDNVDMTRKLSQRLDITMDTKNVSTIQPIESEVPTFSVISNKWKINASLSEYFVYYFVDRVFIGYSKDKESSYWKRSMDKKERLKYSQRYQKIKDCVKYMLLFCSEYPDPYPNNPSEFTKWKVRVQEIAEDSEREIHSFLNLSKPLSVTAFVKVAKSSDWHECKQLPTNTPSNVSEHFSFNK